MNFEFHCLYSVEGARTALNLGGTIFGFYPVRVLPSKTAILPVIPKFLPRVSSLSLVSCPDTIKYCTIPQYANTGVVFVFFHRRKMRRKWLCELSIVQT